MDLNTEPGGGSRPGRLKTRWIDLAEGELGELRMSNWRTMALNPPEDSSLDIQSHI